MTKSLTLRFLGNIFYKSRSVYWYFIQKLLYYLKCTYFGGFHQFHHLNALNDQPVYCYSSYSL